MHRYKGSREQFGMGTKRGSAAAPAAVHRDKGARGQLDTRAYLKKAGTALAWLAIGAAVLGLMWAAVRWVLPFLAPFLIAFALALALRRPARALARSAGIRFRPAAGLLLCLAAAVLLGAAGYLAARVLLLAKLALAQLPDWYAAQLEPVLAAAVQRLQGLPVLAQYGGTAQQAVAALLQRITGALTDAAGAVLTALPRLLVPFVFTCVAAVYFTLDLDALLAALYRRLGEKNTAALRRIKKEALQLLAGLVRAYVLLFGLTFVQLCAGLWLLGVPGAPGLALLIAAVDVLPVLGVGSVLLPWAAVCAVSGQGGLALGLLVLYAVIWTVRQLCEPRLVGRQLGLHPLASLFFLYAGLRLFGLAGALVLPPAATLVWQLVHRRGKDSP